MKKSAVVVILAILLAFSACACGAEKAEAPDMQSVYSKMLETGLVPDMVVVPPEKGEFYFGIAPSDCRQEITAICQNSLLADEIWLIEANDAKSAGQIEELAKARLTQKGEELKSYAPDQYKVVQEAKLLKSGSCVMLIVSPEAEKLQEAAGLLK